MIVITYMGQGMRRDTALKIAELTKHQFYYQPKGQKPSGHPVSNYTLKGTEQIPNQEVVSLIRSVQSVEDTDYGYRKMYYHLMQCGFNINHKKVYRLMKQANLLKEKIKADQTKTYVRYRIVFPGTVRKSNQISINILRFRVPKRGLQVIDYTEVHLVQLNLLIWLFL